MASVTSLSQRRTRYEVKDASGALVATHVRVDNEDGSKAVFWLGPDGSKGLGGMDICDVPLYAVERLGKDALVVVTEGEKAAQALLDVGIQAVGTCTGAAVTPNRGPLADLNGRKVVLWPDADDVGFDHMRRVAARLRGIATNLYWVTVPGAEPHDDAVEALARFGTDGVLEMVLNPGPVPVIGLQVERAGLGYRAYSKVGRVELRLDRVKARSGQVHGELTVRSEDPGAPEDGHLIQHDFNVSSLTSRKTTAEYIGKRAPKIEVDWHALLEEFCRRVLLLDREGLPIESLGDLPRRADVPYLVFPMLPKDRASIIFGEGGSGKSYFAAVLALSVASGHEVFQGWRPARPGKVLVLDWEADREEWNERLLCIAAGAGVDPSEFVGRIRYRSCIVSLVDQVEELAKYVKDEGVDLVIVDSVGMASPGAREGTDANEGALALFRGLRLLRTTTLLVDHVNKASKESASGARDPYGSIFKTNLARQTWEVRREDPEGGEAQTASVLLINRKVNNGPRRDPIAVTITYGDDAVLFERGELDEVSDALAVSVPTKIKIEALLKREGWQTKPEIAEAMPEVKDATLRAAIRKGVADGWLLKDPAKERYGLATRTRVDDADF